MIPISGMLQNQVKNKNIHDSGNHFTRHLNHPEDIFFLKHFMGDSKTNTGKIAKWLNGKSI
jgi:hypothetical protein